MNEWMYEWMNKWINEWMNKKVHRATSTFSSVWDFMIGLGLPQQHANLEVASFSRYKNIIGNPKNSGSSHSWRPHPLVFYGCDYMIGLGKPKLCTKVKVASFSRCRNSKRQPPNWGAPQPRATPNFSSGGISWWFTSNASCKLNLKSLVSYITEI